MTPLYAPGEAERWKKRAGRSRAAAWCCVAAGTAVCAALCTRVNTGNAHRMLITVIAVFTLAGWAGILLRRLAYAPARAEAGHTANLLSGAGEAKKYEGIILAWGDAFTIPRSVTVRRLTLQSGEEQTVLHVDARRAGRLPAVGARVGLETCRKFVTAYEVLNEADETGV